MMRRLPAQAPAEAAAAAAWREGQAALTAGDLAAAARWIDRARRLAPNDPSLLLALASVRLRLGDPGATDLFESLTRTQDVREAWLGLAAARLLAGAPEAAAAALGHVLSRHAAAADPGLQGIADAIAGAAGAPGWCALTGSGVLRIRGLRPDPASAPLVTLDGRALRGLLPDPRGWTLALPPRWSSAIALTVLQNGAPCLGSPIDLGAIRRLEGFVTADGQGLRGWAWHPADPGREPVLVLCDRARNRITIRPDAGPLGAEPWTLLTRRRGFAVPRSDLAALAPPLRVLDRDGRDLPGSPLDPAAAPPDVPARPAGPSFAARRRHAAQRWRQARAPDPQSAILITHDRAGGVERQVAARCAALRSEHLRPILLRPEAGGCRVSDGTGEGFPDLRFRVPSELPALARLLCGDRPRHVEVHHLLGHTHDILDLARLLGVPYEVHVHDYAWFCPRVALVGPTRRYCGEPAAASACERCVAEAGRVIEEEISVAALRQRSGRDLATASRVVLPSADVASRMQRHFGAIRTEIVPWEDDTAIATPQRPPRAAASVRRICVVGAIGIEKGYDVLLDAARDAEARSLALDFVVVGHTIGDDALLATGRVFVTGPFEDTEAVALIRAQDADLAFLPSVWPETWCFTASHVWRAGLKLAAFDIGTPALRIRRDGRGWVLPLALAPGRLNDALLAL